VKITNAHGLPSALVAAAENDDYSRGDADISVTQLIDAPRQRIMGQIYSGHDHVSRDISEMIWPLLGTAFHKIMDQYEEPNATNEERLFADHRGWTISGAIDRQIEIKPNTYKLQDYKVTSVYSFMQAASREKMDWERQLNAYRWLMWKNGRKVRSLKIITLLRDWRPVEAETRFGYPSKPIMPLQINMWSDREVEIYIDDRVALHQSAQQLYDEFGEVMHCSEASMWYTGSKYAVMRAGHKRASKVTDTYEEAEKWRNIYSNAGPSYSIEERPGTYRRCEKYCDFRNVCSQWADIKNNKQIDEVMEALDGSEE